MNGHGYRVDIDRLILIDLEMTPGEAERLRGRLVSELQTALAECHWTGSTAATELERVDMPAVSLGEEQRPVRLASALARCIAQALPGTGKTPRR